MSNPKQKPPRLAEKILEHLLYDDVWKTMLGDLQEYYSILCEEEGKAAADFWYWRQIIQYAPSKLIHKFIWSIEMFKNYLKIAYRNILKNKGYSFINIFGLGVGIASFLLIGIYVTHEMSYDNFHEDSDRIYRLVRQAPHENYQGSNWFGVNPMPLSIALSNDFDGIEAATSFNEVEALMKMDTGSFFEEGIYTDEDFLDIFTFRWYRGDKTTAFDRPEAIIITQSLAEKYFDNQNPIGQTISFDGRFDEPIERTITGVIADLPSNSQLQFSFLVPSFSMDNYDRESTGWNNNNEYQYIKLTAEQDPEALIPRISALSNPKFLEMGYYQENPENLPVFRLIPAEEVHLNSSYINFNPGKIGDKQYVYMLSAIGLIILIIACVNYMNLATARSMGRAKEVGVRKVNGAFRSNIMMQFSAEAVIFSGISILLAFGILYTIFPAFTALVDIKLNTGLFFTPIFWIILLGTGLVVGLVSGSYPAFFMSALRPIGIFKGQIKGGSGNRKLRNSLVIVQFAITNILLLGTIVIFLQVDFIRSNDSGYNRDQILTVKISDPELMSNYEVISQRLESNSDIISVSSGGNLPNAISSQTRGIHWDGKDEERVVRTYTGGINTGYLDLLGIELLAGSTFTDEFTDTTLKVILNEQMVAEMGITPNEAVGEYFRIWRQDATIVGVVQDFNFLSYRSGIDPLVLRQESADRHRYLIMNIAPANLQKTLAYVEQELATFSPDYPFEYAFLDDVFNSMYQNEMTLGRIFNYFTILGLIIACMGLFGLASYMMEQRTKEVGIRKVLGANVFQIMSLLNQDFIRLVGISFLISIPLGWYLANQWLENFAFKISVGPLIFIGMGIASLGIALLTVSYKSFRAAIANPIDSLKSE